MSYDIWLEDKSGEKVVLDEPIEMVMGTMRVGGETEANVNITYNYAPVLYKYVDKEEGIRWLYGKKAKDTIDKLESVISELKDDVSEDYWECTEGNAKRSLENLLNLAKMFPEAKWNGD